MKLLSLFFALSFLSYNLAQDCNNPLLDVFNIEGLSEPVSGEGLRYCPNLQQGQTCCSVETVNNLQNNLDSLSRRLEAIAGQKDIYIAQLNTNFSSQYQDLMDDLSDLDNDLGALQDNFPEVGDPMRNQTDIFRLVSDALDDIDNSFSRALIAYQERRTACFTTLLQIQASAWCLACDPNYATQGVQEDGTVNASPALCDTIRNQCGPFLDQGIYLNALFHAQQSYGRLQRIREFLDAFRNNDRNALPNITIEDGIFQSANATERTVSRPNDNWQCENLFSSQFLLDEEIAANGAGLIGGDDLDLPNLGAIIPPIPVPETEEEIITEVIEEVEETVTEVITEVQETITEVITEVGETVTEVINTETITEQSTRRLQENPNTWDPEIDTTGFIVNVAQDPGNVTNWDGDASDASDADIDDHLAGSRVTITGTVLVGSLVLAALV